jgi:hypothetical protein
MIRVPITGEINNALIFEGLSIFCAETFWF